jgi:hypothetical protein
MLRNFNNEGSTPMNHSFTPDESVTFAKELKSLGPENGKKHLRDPLGHFSIEMPMKGYRDSAKELKGEAFEERANVIFKPGR